MDGERQIPENAGIHQGRLNVVSVTADYQKSKRRAKENERNVQPGHHPGAPEQYTAAEQEVK